MKASVYTKYGSPDVLQVQEVTKPTPADHEVLIKIHATTVSAADCAMRKGDPFVARMATGLRKPKQTILGTEFAGEIVAVGKDVTRFKPGDQIYAASGIEMGAYAEYIRLPEDGAIVQKPANLTYEEAAALCEGVLTALPFLTDTGKIQSGQKVLINGASGSVGTAAVQLAKYYGAEVTGVCSTTNLDMVRSIGADHVIDYTREDFTKNGEQYDIIFDAVGKSSFARCKNSLTRNGIYLTTVPSLAIAFQTLISSRFRSKKAKIALTGLRSTSKKSEDLALLKELVEQDKIRPVIDRQYTLEQTADAHRYVETGHKKGNVILTFA